ncbi:hypothetical protein CMUST_09945 [Corynebacterium mustelae]|uniref:Uncharacterized protein n=1 Tax=Corynebacterium mustelae TaxID=571915 RepID=A0A0G3H0L6_9CORY|nr:hypothetical protein [Corynebacterium mustelae]AKK06305.1 hypothetical protein CMUST_09945 [Corynebacterium mustelae]
MTTFSEQYLARTDEQRTDFLRSLDPDITLTDEDLTCVITDLHRTEDDQLQIEIFQFLWDFFPTSPEAKDAVMSFIKQDNPDELVLSHAAMVLRHFTLTDEDFEAIYRSIETHRTNDYYQLSVDNLIRAIGLTLRQGSRPTALKLLENGYIDQEWFSLYPA